MANKTSEHKLYRLSKQSGIPRNFAPMLVTEVGMVSEVTLWKYQKAQFLISVVPLGITILVTSR